MAGRKSSRVRYSASETLNDDDRISRLPDGVIQHILSFIDTKSVIQTSLLSRSWMNKWKSQPDLNFEISSSPNQASGSRFHNFVHRFLCKRDDVAELSTIAFRSNFIRLPLLKKIITYAMSQRTRKLTIEFSGEKQRRRGGCDLSLFESRHLEHLFLSIDFGLNISPPLTWDFPALTTLSINRATFTLHLPNDDASRSVDLFSQFPNLKTLSLGDCTLSNIDTFIIKSSELESLSLINLHQSCQFVVSAPKLSSFNYNGKAQLSLSAKDLLSLQTVNFQIIYRRSFRKEPEAIKLMIKTFRQLCNAKSLTLNLDAWKVLSAFPELLDRRNCPFTCLQSLTFVSRQLPRSSSVFTGVVNYFTRSSPNLTPHIEIDSTPSRIRF